MKVSHYLCGAATEILTMMISPQTKQAQYGYPAGIERHLSRMNMTFSMMRIFL